MALEVCIESHTLGMFAKKILRVHKIKFMGAQGTLMTFYQTCIVNIAVWVPACIVCLYYASSSAVWGL